MSLIFGEGSTKLCSLQNTFWKATATKQATVKAAADPGATAVEFLADGKATQTLASAQTALDAEMQAVDAACAALAHTHAIVIGVGEYAHLAGGGLFKNAPATFLAGLGQLTCSVESAQAIVDWLVSKHSNNNAPLGSVELVLSPGTYTPSGSAAPKLGVALGDSITIEPATLASCQAAFGRWYARCNSHQDNIALFFFIGHGIENEAQFLLLEDFGENQANAFEHSVNFAATYVHMGECLAKTQCFFVDACRERPFELMTITPKGTIPGSVLKGPMGGSLRERDAPIYRAAAEGKQAFGVANQPTFFTLQLLRCLNGLGASRKIGNLWNINTNSLRTALNATRQFLHEQGNTQVSLSFGGESNFLTDLHFVSQSEVRVLTKVSCQPEDALAHADLFLEDLTKARVVRQGRVPKPWHFEETKPGLYTVGADFDATAPFLPTRLENEIVMPPLYDATLVPEIR